MISVGIDRSIILTDLNTNKIRLKCVDAHTAGIVAVKKLKENSFLTAGADGYVKLWELNDGAVNLIGDSKLHSSPITLLEYYPKYNLIVTSAKEGTLYFTDPKNYAKVAIADMKFLPGGAYGVHWEKPFLYTSDSSTIKKWNNPEFDLAMVAIRKRVQANNANCTIF